MENYQKNKQNYTLMKTPLKGFAPQMLFIAYLQYSLLAHYISVLCALILFLYVFEKEVALYDWFETSFTV